MIKEKYPVMVSFRLQVQATSLSHAKTKLLLRFSAVMQITDAQIQKRF